MYRGIGQYLDRGDGGRKQRANGDTGQYQYQYRIMLAYLPCHRVDQTDGQQPPRKGSTLNGDDRQAAVNGQGRAQTSTGRNAQNVRRGQWVAEHALIGCARGRQGGAHQQAGRDAWQA